MEDILELNVEENEFDIDRSENCQKLEKPAPQWSHLSGKFCDVYREPKVKGPSDAISENLTLVEAKEKLLESLKKLEEDAVSNLTARPSVKSRLGVRETEYVEFMDCSDSEECDYIDSFVDVKKEERLQATANEEIDDVNQSGYPRYEKKSLGKNEKREDIPRRPTMNILRQRLTVKWHHSPEQIGKAIAKRLQERKYNLIINVVKAIGGKKAIELFHETKQIQLNGGMSTNNGSRRRTSGGVFLTLLKTSNYANEDEIKDIFKQDTKIKTEATRRKRALQRQRRREREKMETQSVEETVQQEQCSDEKSVEETVQQEQCSDEITVQQQC